MNDLFYDKVKIKVKILALRIFPGIYILKMPYD